MKVLLEKGVWISNSECDLPWTSLEENAKEFDNMQDALFMLEEVRRYRPFKNAQIMDAFV